MTCFDRWPEAEFGMYDPRCCRFPKSCSALTEEELYVIKVSEALDLGRGALAEDATNVPEVWRNVAYTLAREVDRLREKISTLNRVN